MFKINVFNIVSTVTRWLLRGAREVAGDGPGIRLLRGAREVAGDGPGIRLLRNAREVAGDGPGIRYCWGGGRALHSAFVLLLTGTTTTSGG